jgi:hypothetical protein
MSQFNPQYARSLVRAADEVEPAGLQIYRQSHFIGDGAKRV